MDVLSHDIRGRRKQIVKDLYVISISLSLCYRSVILLLSKVTSTEIRIIFHLYYTPSSGRQFAIFLSRTWAILFFIIA